MEKKRNRLNKEDALEALKKYCAYQERSHNEVRTRLLEYQVYGDDLEDIMAELISEDFLNEERFAKTYARGKFRMKKWGKMKILQELKRRNISDYCIRKAMKEIPLDEYESTLFTLLEKKNSFINTKNIFERRKKLTAFAQSKGYEFEWINRVMNEILS